MPAACQVQHATICVALLPLYCKCTISDLASAHAHLSAPLQEGHDNKGAWRLRQHANLALSQLCEFFRGRLAASMEHCIGERDLDLPNHVDKAQKLLAQNTAVVNITLNPI